MSTAEAERDGTRWQVDARLVEELAAGRTYRQAAGAAGCSLATVTRRMEDRAFRARVREVQDEARKERAQRVRAWQQAGESSLALGLAQLVQLLNDTRTAPAVKLGVTRLLWSTFAPREPVMLLEIEEEPATVAELFDLPESMDQADVISFGRALMYKMTGTGPPSAAALAASLETPGAEDSEEGPAPDVSPAPAGPPSTSTPMGEWLGRVAAAPHEEPEPEPDPEPPPPPIPMPTGPAPAPRWSAGLPTRPAPEPDPEEATWRETAERVRTEMLVRRTREAERR